MLYIPDIDSWDLVKDKMKEWLSKSTFALLDGTFYSGNELPGRDIKLVPHPTIENSIQFLHALPPFKCAVYFTHLNHTNPLLDAGTVESVSLAKTAFRIAKEWQEFEL